jgi:hypothetical protein
MQAILKIKIILQNFEWDKQKMTAALSTLVLKKIAEIRLNFHTRPIYRISVNFSFGLFLPLKLDPITAEIYFFRTI